MKGGRKLRVFTAEFKAQVVQRMLAGESVSQLSREVKVKQARTAAFAVRVSYLKREGVVAVKAGCGDRRGLSRGR